MGEIRTRGIGMDADFLRQRFIQCFPLEAVLYTPASSSWEEVIKELPYVPVAYLRSSLEYQHCYMRAFVEDLIDISVILQQNGRYIGIWPLSLRKRQGIYEFATNQGAVLPPVYKQGVSERLIRKYDDACLAAMRKFYQDIKGEVAFSKAWESTVSFLPSSLLLQNIIWEQKCMLAEARASVLHDLYVDLSKTEEELHKNLRKSYRSLINEGERLWNIEVHDQVDTDLFDEYRLLHKEISGRITRPLETWVLQRKAINNGRDFLVTLRNNEQKLIGGGLFEASPHEGRYAVGAYDRNLFDKPVSHIVQWTAIKHLKELGCLSHYVGQRFYPGDVVQPSDKELKIAYFKEGFATDMVLRLLLIMVF